MNEGREESETEMVAVDLTGPPGDGWCMVSATLSLGASRGARIL